MQLLRVNVGRKTFKENSFIYEILNIQHIQSVRESCGQMLGKISTYRKQKHGHINMCLEAFYL
jgi:uncharacterized protein YrrD